MDTHFLNESLTWRAARTRRIKTFLRVIAIIMIFEALTWVGLTASVQQYFLTWALLALIGCASWSLWLIRKNKLLLPKFILLFSLGAYFLFVCLFASGYPSNNGTTHFGFILMSVLAYFLLSDLKIYREIIAAFFLVLFFCYQFEYAPFYPIMVVSPEQDFMLVRIDVISILVSIFLVTRYFVLEINKSEHALAISADQLESITESVLPKSVIKRVREEGKTFADHYDDCSILFADISHFTQWAEQHTAVETVIHLNNLFSRFDLAVENFNLTKIKTIGDAYMVAAGIPSAQENHAIQITALALELQRIAADYGQFSLRIGIHSGPAVAGIIGKKTLLFDVWGDTVNIASRMETSGESDKVNISEATFNKVESHFNCFHRGKISAKNKGELDMYFVESTKL